MPPVRDIDRSGMTMQAGIKDYLSNDATLTTLLPGGVHDAEDHDQGGLTSDNIPRAANGVTILTTAFLSWKSGARVGDMSIGAGRQDLEIYVYADRGYASIDPVITRLIDLLDNVNFLSSDRTFVHLFYNHLGPQVPAEEIGDAPSQFVRFAVTQIRS